MEAQSFFLFLVAAVTLNITPGPDVIYVMSRSINQGRKAGVLSAIGLGLGYLVHTIAAALGLSVLLMSSALAFHIIKYVGAIYLIYLGVKTLLAKQKTEFKVDIQLTQSRKLIWQGIMTSVLNPKVALFFIAFLPQFVKASSSVVTQFLFLGIVFTLTATIWNTLIGFFAGYIGEQLRGKDYLMKLQQWLTGLTLIGLGGRLALIEQK